MPQDATKMPPRRLQDALGRAKTHPMHARNAPKTHQDCPRCPQTPQRQSQGLSKSRFLMIWEAKKNNFSMIFLIIQLANLWAWKWGRRNARSHWINFKFVRLDCKVFSNVGCHQMQDLPSYQTVVWSNTNSKFLHLSGGYGSLQRKCYISPPRLCLRFRHWFWQSSTINHYYFPSWCLNILSTSVARPRIWGSAWQSQRATHRSSSPPDLPTVIS